MVNIATVEEIVNNRDWSGEKPSLILDNPYLLYIVFFISFCSLQYEGGSFLLLFPLASGLCGKVCTYSCFGV